MTIIPLQFFGLGDIIFTQTLIQHLAGSNRIMWPVRANLWEGLSRAYPNVDFVLEETLPSPVFDLKKDIIIELNGKKCRIIPIRWADSILKVPYKNCMRAKYDLYGLDWRSWKGSWMRYSERERHLMRLNRVIPGEPYNLISEVYGTDMQMNAPIKVDNGLRNIRIRAVEGFSLFDWAILMEHATEIHFVASSNIYLLEQLDLQAKRICIYPRLPKLHHEEYNYLMTSHNYIFL